MCCTEDIISPVGGGGVSGVVVVVASVILLALTLRQNPVRDHKKVPFR